MNQIDKLQLDKMIQENDIEDCTEAIRTKKHSQKIRDDVTRLLDLKKNYSEIYIANPELLENMMIAQCGFLFTNYTDIYHKVRKDEIILETLWNFLDILKRIEDGDIDQHSGAYEVGNILKKMYIDSALVKAEKLDQVTGEKMDVAPPVESKKISWKEYKAMNDMQ
jgi:hypothetical protein